MRRGSWWQAVGGDVIIYRVWCEGCKETPTDVVGNGITNRRPEGLVNLRKRFRTQRKERSTCLYTVTAVPSLPGPQHTRVEQMHEEPSQVSTLVG